MKYYRDSNQSSAVTLKPDGSSAQATYTMNSITNLVVTAKDPKISKSLIKFSWSVNIEDGTVFELYEETLEKRWYNYEDDNFSFTELFKGTKRVLKVRALNPLYGYSNWITMQAQVI